MALKYGDLIPADCADVGPLLLRNFKDDGTQHVAKNDSPGSPTIQGGHLLRVDPIFSNLDYENEALVNNVEVCEDVRPFGEAAKLLRLRIETVPAEHCGGPTSQHQGVIYPVGYFGLVEGGDPSIVAGAGPYPGGTYGVGVGYAGQPWRLAEYTWTDFGSAQNILDSGVVPGDGLIVYGPGAISGVSLTGGGTNTRGAVSAQFEVSCDGVWPDPPASPF